MGNSIVVDRAMRALTAAMDGLSLRQQAITHNVTNADTPGYKAVDVSFEGQLQQALKGQPDNHLQLAQTHAGHLAAPAEQFAAQTVRRSNTAVRNDGNSVDIDLEMSQLAETTLRYNALTLLTGKKLSLIKNVITGSRR